MTINHTDLNSVSSSTCSKNLLGPIPSSRRKPAPRVRILPRAAASAVEEALVRLSFKHAALRFAGVDDHGHGFLSCISLIRWIPLFCKHKARNIFVCTLQPPERQVLDHRGRNKSRPFLILPPSSSQLEFLFATRIVTCIPQLAEPVMPRSYDDSFFYSLNFRA